MSSPSRLNALKLWLGVTMKSLRNIPVDLSTRQMGVLLTVYLSGEGAHSIKSLAQRLNISKPAVCRAVDMLSHAGLLKRKRDEKDRRNVYLQRTVKGSVFLSEFADMIAAEKAA